MTAENLICNAIIQIEGVNGALGYFNFDKVETKRVKISLIIDWGRYGKPMIAILVKIPKEVDQIEEGEGAAKNVSSLRISYQPGVKVGPKDKSEVSEAENVDNDDSMADEDDEGEYLYQIEDLECLQKDFLEDAEKDDRKEAMDLIKVTYHCDLMRLMWTGKNIDELRHLAFTGRNGQVTSSIATRDNEIPYVTFK